MMCTCGHADSLHNNAADCLSGDCDCRSYDSLEGDEMNAIPGAIVSKVVVTSGKKLSNGAYGSDEAALVLEATLAPDANVDEVVLALQAYCDAYCSKALVNPIEAMRERAMLAPDVVVNLAAPAKEPTRTKLDDSGNEFEYIKVSGLTVQFTPGGKKVGKIKGGPYVKHGVNAWPEILATVGIKLDTLDAGDYVLPELHGKTAVCLMKVSDKTGKPYPDKVVEFVE